MKEHIHTIPVIEALEEKGECPFCSMYKKLEEASIDYTLGPSYMEDDIRAVTDEKGFCKTHYEKLFAKQNALGLALILHTHIQKINKDLDPAYKAALGPIEKKGLFSKPTTDSRYVNLYATIDKFYDDCYICDRVQNTFDRYIDTFFLLWKDNNGVRELTQNSSGFCISHFSLILKIGEKKLNANEYKEFIDIVIPNMCENMKRIEEELDWFIKKFDYRFTNEPWKNSQDALPRSIQKVASLNVEE